jgi:uncharacterized phage protein gp47/JayE
MNLGFVIKYFDTITASLVSWFSGNTAKITDMTVGSSIRLMFEAVGVELEGIYYQIYSGIINGIQNGVYQSFNFPLLQPQPASGSVVFSNLTPAPGGGTTIPAGTQVSTAGVNGAAPVTYQTTDTVVMLAGTTSIAAIVIATTTGSVGNAIGGAINVLVGSPSGVSSVTNPVAFFSGSDLETTSARAARFQTYIANLSRGTLGALENAALSVLTVVNAVAFESPILNVFIFSGVTGFSDISFGVNIPSGPPQQVLNPVTQANDCLYIGAPSRFNVLKIDLDAGMAGGTYVWEYYSVTNASWLTLPTSSDSTDYLSDSGYLSFTKPTDWVDTVVNSVRKFYIRLRVVTPTTSQVATAVQIKAYPFPGVIFLVAMDAAASLPPSLATLVSNAVSAYQSAGTQVFVTGPTITALSVTASIQISLTADPIAMQATLLQAVANFMSTFTLGQEFVLSQLVQYIRNQSTDVLDVQVTTPATNRDAAFDEVFQAGTLNVSVYQ